MGTSMKQTLLKISVISLLLTLVFLISPSSSSSSSNQETKTETSLNVDVSPHQLVYIKNPIILNRRLRNNHHQYYTYDLHSLHLRGLAHREDNVKMKIKKKSNRLNRHVQPDPFFVMLPRGNVPPSGQAPSDHN